LKETFVVGDQRDPFDSPKQRVGRYPEIARRLYGASIGVVAEPAEKSGCAICVVEDLNVLGSEFKIVLLLLVDVLSPLLRTQAEIIGARSLRDGAVNSSRLGLSLPLMSGTLD
jgi:hypothetical protein